MSNLDKMGADTLKELQNEESDIRIADIFHDVARGQHLTVFRDYTRRLFPKGPFPELDHHKMFDLLQERWSISILSLEDFLWLTLSGHFYS